MTENATISISLILSVISCIGVIVAIISTIRKDNENEQNRQMEIEKNFVKINVKLDNFCDDTKSILKYQERANDEIKSLSESIVKDNEKIETLFKYKDDHEERIKKLEERA